MSVQADETIVIAGATGAAGGAIAQGMAEKNFNVSLLYRSESQYESLSKKFGKENKHTLFCKAELTDFVQVQKAVAATQKKFDRIDMLVNASGGWIGGKKLHEHSVDELDQMLDMDLRPTFHLMQAVLPIMIAQKSGKIINFASLSALQGGANISLYAASKNAVLTLSRAAAEEYRSLGIQVFCIAPGIINSEANRKAMPNADHSKWVALEEIIETVSFIQSSTTTLSGTLFKLGGR